jgi:alpha-1,3-glucosyltransferase
LFFGFLPFIDRKNGIFLRLFPWGRGLVNTYWAPNIWSLYNTIDILLNYGINKKFTNKCALGLVGMCNPSILPSIYPITTFIGIFIGISYVYFYVQRTGKNNFCETVCLTALVFFSLGWHVHEKAILMISIPLM